MNYAERPEYPLLEALADQVRSACASVIRLLTEEDLAPLRALAKARREVIPVADSLVQVMEPFRPGGDDPAWQAEMRRRIAQQFPRDPDGRLSLQTEVLLAPREPDQSPSERGLWYTVTGPERRRDPAVLRVAWAWRTGDLNSHVWEAAPCRWNPDVPETDYLSPPELPWELLRFTDRDAHLAALAALPGTAASRIARALLLQDEGRIGEALSLWGIAVDDTVQDWLDGVGVGCERVREGLRRAALWRFADLVHAEEERLTAWRDAKKGRPRKIPHLRLFALPQQTIARKKCLFLTPNGLEQIETASEARVPLALWQRPVEIDLRRFGLWKEEE